MENDRCLQASRDGLAYIDIPRDNNAIDRRRNRAMIKIRFGFVQRALFDFHVRFRLMKICHRLIKICLRGCFPGEKVLGTRGVHFRELQRGLRAGQVALSLSDRCLKEGRIDLRDHLAGFDLGIKIDKQLCDVP